MLAHACSRAHLTQACERGPARDILPLGNLGSYLENQLNGQGDRSLLGRMWYPSHPTRNRAPRIELFPSVPCPVSFVLNFPVPSGMSRAAATSVATFSGMMPTAAAS